ncbi:hypothetical protein CFD26_103934 [Aspergillus turcosus]|uniref:Uncharacterized protein n=1 Tax=Aspergillus turcosus TaxID=1245748 RepID=A0A3R7IE89_9EURO|nr:hypothetical protein CFD26_103934 [Aspergillus turcosus]
MPDDQFIVDENVNCLRLMVWLKCEGLAQWPAAENTFDIKLIHWALVSPVRCKTPALPTGICTVNSPFQPVDSIKMLADDCASITRHVDVLVPELCDKVLPAPIQLGANDKDRKAIESYFPKGLPTNWGVIYHQTKIYHDEMFLCSNWAGHRVKQDLGVGDEYPSEKEHPVDTVDYKIGDRVDLLAQLDLWDASKKKLKFIEECDDATDPERMLIIWGIGQEPPAKADDKDKPHIGHISVKWNGRWESKLSTAHYASGSRFMYDFGSLTTSADEDSLGDQTAYVPQPEM